MSQPEVASEHHQYLDTTQEEALTGLINCFINRDLPPTNSMVKNLAEEIIGRPVNKN